MCTCAWGCLGVFVCACVRLWTRVLVLVLVLMRACLCRSGCGCVPSNAFNLGLTTRTLLLMLLLLLLLFASLAAEAVVYGTTPAGYPVAGGRAVHVERYTHIHTRVCVRAVRSALVMSLCLLPICAQLLWSARQCSCLEWEVRFEETC